MTTWITPLRISLVSVGLLALVLLLPSCSRNNEDLPTGVQTLTGVLTPVPLSLSRRGTHLLNVQGEDIYLVESSKANLREVEGMDVIVTGLVEANIDPDALPLLVASGVRLVDLPMKLWDVPALKLTLEVPENWIGTVSDDGISFTQTGSIDVFLTVASESGVTIPSSPNTVMVGGVRGTNVIEAGYETVYVATNGTVYIFRVTREINGITYVEASDYLRVLQSVHFGRAASSVRRPPSSATGSGGTGAPCGGPAGVLCPSGQYCEVFDPKDGVGRCRSLQR